MSPNEPWSESWKIIKDNLGEGGQGFTRLVELTSNPGTQGVLKTLRAPNSVTARSRMHQEVAALQRLGAEKLNVPTVLATNTEKYADTSVTLFFIMEHIPGCILNEVVESRGRLTLDEAARITLALCKTVSAAHGYGVIHRDIKPDNIIARDIASNDIVIVDYGLSFNKSEEEQNITHATEQFGSRFLVLPEMRTGDRRDPRSDICAVAAILYFLLVGKKPGLLLDSNSRPIHRSPGKSIRECLGEDQRCRQVELMLDRALAYDIQQRFQTWEEFTERLQHVLKQDISADGEETVQSSAHRLGNLLMQHDQATRIHMYRPNCQELWAQFQEYVNNISQSIGGRFKFEWMGPINRSKRAISVDVPNSANLASGPMTLKVYLPPHPMACYIRYIIEVDSNQFKLRRILQLVRIDSQRGGRTSQEVFIGDAGWNDGEWFDPADWPDFEIIRRSVEKDLMQALTRVTNQVLPPELTKV